jgi:hypothetical protein
MASKPERGWQGPTTTDWRSDAMGHNRQRERRGCGMAIPETLYEYLSQHGVSYDVIPHQKTNCSRMNARNECSRSIRCKSRGHQAQERLRAGGRSSLARGCVETFGSVIRASGLPRHRTGTPWSVHGLRSRRHSASGPSLRHSDDRRQAAA